MTSDRYVDLPIERVAIVSTSVGNGIPGAWRSGDKVVGTGRVTRSPTAYAEWAKQGDLIVAGDLNSDPDLEAYVNDVGGEYLTPKTQEKWPFSTSIGWNCIQRRNVAVMEAYSRGYDFVVTVDDDNVPLEGWVDAHVRHILGHYPEDTLLATGDDGWVDIGQFNVPPIRQRGTPYGSVRFHTVKHTVLPQIVVSQAQILGDPDCDAVTRIAHQPQVTGVSRNVVVSTKDYAAFNSQATMWHGKWAPLIACLPGVGRYDDIIASFIAKRIMSEHGVSVYAGEPCVVQDRNPHDFTSDLRREIWGMDHTPLIVRSLESVPYSDFSDLMDAYGACTEQLNGILPPETISFMKAWRRSWSVWQHD